MKKIVTLSLGINTHDLNFGAILHNYAMVEFLNSNGLGEAEILDYVPETFLGFNPHKPFIYYMKKKKLKSMVKSIVTYRSFRRRYEKFERFKKNYIPISKEKYLGEKSLTNELSYDVVISESDVIWSVNFFAGRFEKAFFMAVPAFENLKKIAYSPSMANDIFTDKQKAEFRKLTQNIDYISGRESYSVEFYREITNRMDIPHVLDPVFLLPEAKYIEIAETSRMKIDTPYLLIYLPVDDNETLVEQAATYAEKHGLTLIELSHRNYKRNHKVIFDIGPEDFLYLLYNSNVVFTNSFHAICFSILFQKEFYAFSRANAGKVEDMCKQFGLEERYFSDNVLIERKDIDYSLINESVNTKIEASKQWLIDAIES